MKSQIIFQNNKAFVLAEIMIAMSLFSIFVITILTFESSIKGLKILSDRELAHIKENDFEKISTTTFKMYGNFTKIYDMDLYETIQSDYRYLWGRDNCDTKINLLNEYRFDNNGFDIGYNNISTDIETRNGYLYLTANSANTKDADLFILDIRQDNNYKIISKLDTGPGVNAIEVAGPYIFLANASTQYQLQIIDIHDRSKPKLISQLKLPLPNASTTAPFAQSIYYQDKIIFLGTSKWNGNELAIIDVSNPFSPKIISTIETNTLVNDIFVYKDILYISTSDEEQLQIFDISDMANPKLIKSFSPSGSNLSEGRVIEYFENHIVLGRTTGGFNSISNHEIFLSNNNMNDFISKDIKGGVYGLIYRDNAIALLTHESTHKLQIWDNNLSKLFKEYDLGNSAWKISCDNESLYFVSRDADAFSSLKIIK